MATRNLPLNTWIVVEQEPSRERTALISTHDCQRAAEVECDRRNRASPEHPYQACILLEPIAERMGGQCSPTAPSRHSR
jgi:hypothetical protein